MFKSVVGDSVAPHRSPFMGFNHNMQHLGWLFHVQTEDGGLRHPRVVTHLFHRGVILATRRNDYNNTWSDDDVKELMITQHKGVLRELRQGVHDDHIKTFLGEPPKREPAPPVEPAAPAASWPTSIDTAQASDWEWREELHDNPDQATNWGRAALEKPTAPKPAQKRTMVTMPAVRAPRTSGDRTLPQIFGGREQLLRAFFPNGRLNGLIVQSVVPLKTGERIQLQIEVGGEAGMEFQIEGTIAWKGLEKRAWGVEFPSEEATAVRRMVLVMRGERAARRRTGPLMVSGTGQASVGAGEPTSVDVTERGIFIPDARDLSPGDMVPVRLAATEEVPTQQVTMMVEWRSEAQGGGAGLRFVSGDPLEELAVTQWVQSVLQS